jgi:hypothetical protein
MMNPDRPLDLASMTEDELFEVLGLSDMNGGERLNFLRHMSAWSHTFIPGPAKWWRHARVTNVFAVNSARELFQWQHGDAAIGRVVA